MTELLDGLTSLMNQLLAIGSEHVELLIACIVVVGAIGVTITLFCISVVLSIPILCVYGVVKLIVWLYRRKHPVYYVDEEEDFEEQTISPEPEDLTPVYPDWMNKKGGRLL